MKKAILRKALQGTVPGIAIGYAVTILLSLVWGGGEYLPVRPELARAAGSEAAAVVVQALLCAGVGAVFSALAVVWDREDWSLARQTLTYFLGTAAAMLPAAWLGHWMEHSLSGFVFYTGFFALFFLVFWLICCAAARRTVRRLNAGLRRAQK